METIFDSYDGVPELPTKDNAPPTIQDVKKFRKQFITRALPTVIKCGHKQDPEIPPRSNCIYCWLTYFNSSSERIDTWKQMLQEENGEQEIRSFYGNKYLKHLKNFLKAIDGKE